MLKDGEGKWQLRGSDRVVAQQFISNGGIIGFSQAYYVGDRIRIIDGFLKSYEGDIIKVNRHAKTAMIKVMIENKVFSAWLGFELINK